MLDKMEKVENVLYADKVRFSFDADRQSGQDVLMVDSLSKSFEDNLYSTT